MISIVCWLWFCITFTDDYLGQVIVPLSTVNRDQTCRLILPVLPRSSKSEHSKGDISLEVRKTYAMKVLKQTLLLLWSIMMQTMYYTHHFSLSWQYCLCFSVLQFTFDKDGKVIDATLPLISGSERKVPSSGKPLYYCVYLHRELKWEKFQVSLENQITIVI